MYNPNLNVYAHCYSPRKTGKRWVNRVSRSGSGWSWKRSCVQTMRSQALRRCRTTAADVTSSTVVAQLCTVRSTRRDTRATTPTTQRASTTFSLPTTNKSASRSNTSKSKTTTESKSAHYRTVVNCHQHHQPYINSQFSKFSKPRLHQGNMLPGNMLLVAVNKIVTSLSPVCCWI